MKLNIKKIEIEPEFIENVNKHLKRKSLEITYYNGYLIGFDKCNIESISPHKIVVGNDEKNLLIMHYANYMENDGLYFIDGIKEPFSITSLKEYVKNYF